MLVANTSAITKQETALAIKGMLEGALKTELTKDYSECWGKDLETVSNKIEDAMVQFEYKSIKSYVAGITDIYQTA